MERIAPQARKIAERVVAVARALTRDDDARLPALIRREEQLPLAERGRPRIEVVSRDVVDREPVAHGTAG